MNRRDFIKALAAVPALAWLKPEVAGVEPEPIEANLVASDEIIYLQPEIPDNLIRWNGAGDSWESIDSGATWNLTGFRPTLEIQPDGALYVSGDFLEEDVQRIRQRHYDYYQNIERVKEENPT